MPCPLRLPSPQQRKSAFMLSSVGARFRKQLAGLIATLGHCQPHYIR
jgi:myosin heavy subunit